MQKLSGQWVTDQQRFGKTNMDFAALQQKLFDLDPSDRAEDLRRLTESVGDMPQESAQTQENFVQESVEIAEGTMPVEGDYNLNDFAKLAGVTLNEGVVDGAKAAMKRGWDNHSNLGAVGISNPLKSLVTPGKTKPNDKANVAAKKPSKSILSAFLKKHTAQLHNIAADPRKSKKFDDFMAKIGEDVDEGGEVQSKTGGPMGKKNQMNKPVGYGIPGSKTSKPKTRNPVASHAQSSGSGPHTDKKKQPPGRKDKHKKQLNFESTESIKEMLYRKLNAKK